VLGWLHLHCGVPAGHVFEGKLEVLLTVDRDGSWRVVSPHWRSRRRYSLDGYLLLEGREKKGTWCLPSKGNPEAKADAAPSAGAAGLPVWKVMSSGRGHDALQAVSHARRKYLMGCPSR